MKFMLTWAVIDYLICLLICCLFTTGDAISHVMKAVLLTFFTMALPMISFAIILLIRYTFNIDFKK